MGDSTPDHEGIAINCDPHYYDYKEGLGPWQGPFSGFRRCVYQRDAFEYAMDYVKDFWRAYPSENKAFMVNFLDMHEGTHEVVNHLDRPLARFLRDMEHQDTTIVLFSDHGPHMGGLLKAIGGTQHYVELFNPMFFAQNLRGLSPEAESNLQANQ